MRPAGLEGNITFGLEDPYRMGQILSLCALFYPVYGERIEVCPVFGGNALKGRIRLRGRVRLGTLLFIAIRLFFDKNLRKLFRKYMNRGGI